MPAKQMKSAFMNGMEEKDLLQGPHEREFYMASIPFHSLVNCVSGIRMMDSRHLMKVSHAEIQLEFNEKRSRKLS